MTNANCAKLNCQIGSQAMFIVTIYDITTKWNVSDVNSTSFSVKIKEAKNSERSRLLFLSWRMEKSWNAYLQPLLDGIKNNHSCGLWSMANKMIELIELLSNSIRLVFVCLSKLLFNGFIHPNWRYIGMLNWLPIQFKCKRYSNYPVM